MQLVSVGGYTKPREGGADYWASQKDNLVELYVNQKLSSNVIGRQYYHCWGSTILDALKRLDIPIRHSPDGERANALYQVDEHFFDTIDSEEKAYILGFFLADGHISSKGNLMFGIHERDQDILEQIKAAMHAEHPIHSHSWKRTLTITAKRITERLLEFGFTNHKTFDTDIHTVLPFVPQELLRHFVRGMFDGDGSIQIYYYDYFKHPSYHFGYTGLLNVVNYIKAFCGLHTKLADEGNGIFTCVSSCYADICRIGHLLYDDATIYCHRKRNTFLEIYQHKK